MWSEESDIEKPEARGGRKVDYFPSLSSLDSLDSALNFTGLKRRYIIAQSTPSSTTSGHPPASAAAATPSPEEHRESPPDSPVPSSQPDTPSRNPVETDIVRRSVLGGFRERRSASKVLAQRDGDEGRPFLVVVEKQVGRDGGAYFK